jgi:hypothetical protein
LILAIAVCIGGIPAYVIAKRRRMKNPGVAFVPLLGFWIVMFESMGRSGWLALLSLVPYVGALAVIVWTAVELPARHDRSRWWTAALIVPVANLVGYWVYAFTLPHRAAPVLMGPSV